MWYDSCLWYWPNVHRSSKCLGLNSELRERLQANTIWFTVWNYVLELLYTWIYILVKVKVGKGKEISLELISRVLNVCNLDRFYVCVAYKMYLTENISIIFLKSAMFIRTSSLSLSWSSFLKFKRFIKHKYFQQLPFMYNFAFNSSISISLFTKNNIFNLTISTNQFILPFVGSTEWTSW